MRPARLLTASTLIVIAFASLYGRAGDVAASPAPGTVTVTVGDLFFCGPMLAPAACRTAVKQGDKVLWDYTAGSVQHTVTHCGDSCDSPTSVPLFDSEPISPGQSFSFTFDVPGTYLYRCRFHPEAMRAQVLVVPPEATVSTTRFATNTAAAPTSTAAPTAAPSATSPPAGAPGASPTAQASRTMPASLPVVDGLSDDGGTSAWVYVAIGIGGAAVLVAAGYFALRRMRRP